MKEFQNQFIAACPKGVEPLLKKEVEGFASGSIKEIPGAVLFSGELKTAMQLCMWSRTASRVFLVLAEFPARDADELYRNCLAFPWEDHMSQKNTFAVSGNVYSSNITHSQFAALKVKDSLADYFRNRYNERPSVNTDQPDLQFHVFINQNHASLRLDLSGESLHKRGYRKGIVSAPMKENLAAAVLLYSNWQWIAKEGGPFYDLMCGSGTFAVEAAMIAGNIAPGIFRKRFGFEKWKHFDPASWEIIVSDAETKRKEGQEELPEISGFDLDPAAVNIARENAEAAGLKDQISFEVRSAEEPGDPGSRSGLVVLNPPYGERMGAGTHNVQSGLDDLYEKIGERLRHDFLGWQCAVFTGNPDAAKNLRLRPKKARTLFNGPIECRLLHFDLKKEIFFREDRNLPPEALSEGALMFKNRIEKNIKSIGKWARKNQIICYRLYDADIPQYAVAADLYENFLHIQEYEAPKTIDEKLAKKRLRESVRVLKEVLKIPDDRIFLKVRRKQKGLSQYESSDEEGEYHVVHEGGLKFLVNFSGYLDTGLFLDHRKTRFMIRDLADKKDFLNLFAYTGSASVYAAAGGALSTTTVDMSRTYLEWAEKNMKLNGLAGPEHVFIRDNCLEWIQSCTNTFDLIFLDPPTFSNSSRMEGTLEIQRDHAGMIRNTAKLLKKGGIILFSNNFRNFKMDSDLLSEFKIKNITNDTIQKDFTGNPKIHNCWLIERTET